MFDVICTFGGNEKAYSILDFQKLKDEEIEKLRHSLVCPKCRGNAFYRKKSVNGNSACFGSRYCSCRETTVSPQRQRESGHAAEVEKILAESDAIEISFGVDNKTGSSESIDTASNKPGEVNSQTVKKSHSIESNKKRVSKVSLEKILFSLMRGTGLASSDTIVKIDGYEYKAKNLFVKIPDAMPLDKEARRYYWGTIDTSDKKIEWLNAAECRDVWLPLGSLRKTILNKFNISTSESLEGAAIIFSGKCKWNKDKTKKIIRISNADHLYISLQDE